MQPLECYLCILTSFQQREQGIMVSYLEGCSFLICMSYCLFFPLGLTLYMEDQYTFSLDPCSFNLLPVPLGNLTPVPTLLFSS